jgi:hypothetical protein
MVAHVRAEPALTDVNAAVACTRTGNAAERTVPFPSWPEALPPQQKSAPSLRKAQV